MRDAQLEGEPKPDRAGNLFKPAPGAVVDGRFSGRTRATRHEFWTSRERDMLVAGVAGAAFIGLAGVVALARAPRRLLGGDEGGSALACRDLPA